MYPLLQGYDSVVMDVDLEIGGTDQEFNMLVGRELQKKMNNRDKYVLTTPMILGTDGKMMSKTSGNCIFLDEKAEEMYKKLMAVTDDLIATYFELLTDIPMEEIQALDPNTPVENKKKLAYEITRQFHGESGAQNAQKHFESVVQAKGVDENLSPIKIMTTLYETLKNASLGVSNSDIRRTIEQGGVEVDGVKMTDPNASVAGDMIKFGKHIRRKLEST
jgi:tyrosyl-tRNA synthetase